MQNALPVVIFIMIGKNNDTMSTIIWRRALRLNTIEFNTVFYNSSHTFQTLPRYLPTEDATGCHPDSALEKLSNVFNTSFSFWMNSGHRFEQVIE